MVEPPRILVVDDDARIRELLESTLRFAGFDVTVAASGRECLDLVGTSAVDLVLLDVVLPDLGGFELVRLLRSRRDQVPVVFLTARDGVDDRIAGLGVGGDDYVTKPFDVGEVVARLTAVLRRTRGGGNAPEPLRVDDLVLDPEAHRVTRGDREVELSPTEYRLLHYLMVNAGRVVSKAQILDHVWQYDFGGDGAVVEKFISTLRRKVDADAPALIRTVRGFGYTVRGG
ncbi:response regulator transcription factor [Actinophytocola xanthii]|uniref:DNA-binding response regulator n=1 Tax=Actinophytocola xanthii TaxID=1912961 RepID=A0A1Q8CYE7_9PSEU|nr:response regulator transcription factor [Actinophytocola xanthii]OLF19377.1 DNA-binding response regulator [Actinophytocola xanthii]